MPRASSRAVPKKTKKRELPKYCYQRRNKIWIRIKDEDGKWVSEKTPFTVDQVDEAARFVRARLKDVREFTGAPAARSSDLTVEKWAERWSDDRAQRGIPSAEEDRLRLRNHVLPHIGNKVLADVGPRDVRDMVRELRAAPEEARLAPRTILNIIGLCHTMFRDAEVDELVERNPVKLHRGEAPKKVDADPEWRAQATFTTREVEALISSPVIPLQRRVMYALKSIAGLRHGEAAAACWRHLDRSVEPFARLHVVQSFSSRTGEVKRVKTEYVRSVPVHPSLALILDAWRTEHWPRVYGRAPTDDDHIAPAMTMRPMSAADAVESMKRDLRALDLRVEAGAERDRGGHDLRSWYKTQTIEDGADSLIIQRTTHATPKDVEGGYQRFSWATMCREVGKLRVLVPGMTPWTAAHDHELERLLKKLAPAPKSAEVTLDVIALARRAIEALRVDVGTRVHVPRDRGLDGGALPVATQSLHAEASARSRWGNEATPTGFEPGNQLDRAQLAAPSPSSASNDDTPRVHDRVTRAATRPQLATAARVLERALRAGDIPKALDVARQLKYCAEPTVDRPVE